MSAGDLVFISGITGPFADAINGGYDRTSEVCDGYALYVKRGDASTCIEHYEGRWKVKPVSCKGTNVCSAYVAGGCGLEACTSRVWKVGDGKAFHDAPAVKLVAGAEAQRHVSPMSAGDVVFISGATGLNAAGINGAYYRTSEVCNGYALYAKRGDASMCIEHPDGDWEVKLVSQKGTGTCWAYVAGGCGLEACTSRVWTVYDGKTWNDAPAVKLVAGAEAVAERQVRGGCLHARQHAPAPQLQPTPSPPPPPPAISPFSLFCVTRFCFCAVR
jgi:hypothetical protein